MDSHSPQTPGRPLLLTALLLACAALRLGLGDPAPAAADLRPALGDLPPSLAGRAGSPVALNASEELLAASPRVQLQRRAYGPTQVALVTSTGVKEHHPPAVCLRAAGYEVVQRQELATPAGCLVALRVRARSGDLAHFYYTYVAGDGQTTTCSYWRRAGAAALGQLLGRPGAWSTLQVLDSDARRARRALENLLNQTRRTS